MKIERFDPPGNIDDFGNDQSVRNAWSKELNSYFTEGVLRVSNFLNDHGAGRSQFYNPLTEGITDPDTLQPVPWNGFPKRFGATQPGQLPNFAAAEPSPNQMPVDVQGRFRPQDEYLEWHVERDDNNRITRVQFTCEGPDYWLFLARQKPDKVLELYRKFISDQVQPQDLFQNNQYNPRNKWNTTHGAMHLTHRANNLYAEVQLAAEATVRRQKSGQELTGSIPLIRCAEYGNDNRNSDPKIGIEVNKLARQGFMITLQNPVGLYIDKLDDIGWKLSNGTSAQGFFRILRGQPGQILRAEYRLPTALANQGFTVSDVKIGGTNINFGGQIAEKITMKLVGAACRPNSVNNGLTPCGQIPNQPGPLGILEAETDEALEAIKVKRKG